MAAAFHALCCATTGPSQTIQPLQLPHLHHCMRLLLPLWLDLQRQGTQARRACGRGFQQVQRQRGLPSRDGGVELTAESGAPLEAAQRRLPVF